MARIAVLVDAESVRPHFAETIINHARSLGDTNIVRVFGDFAHDNLADWSEIARQQGFEIVSHVNGGKGKNTTDIVLSINAMDILAAGAVDAFCLVNNDRDFVPLAIRLRGAGKRVHVICLRVNPQLKNICSTFLELQPADQPKAVAESSAPSPPILSEDERAFIIDTVKEFCGEDTARALAPALLGNELKKRHPALAARIGGPGLLKRLVMAGIVDEHGSGPNKTMTLKGAA